MNLYKTIFLWIIGIVISLSGYTYAQNTGSKRVENPIMMMDSFAQGINSWTRIQDNALNDFNPNQWQYASEYKITNTFDSIRQQIAPYIQWTMYLGLSIAVIGIIYNGFLMVTKPVGSDGDSWKVKSRLTNIIIWVFLLTGFYVIIQTILGLIAYMLQ